MGGVVSRPQREPSTEGQTNGCLRDGTTTNQPRLSPPTVKTFDDYDPKFVSELSIVGNVPFTAYSLDNRFSYCLYIPEAYGTLSSIPLVVLVHGSGRDAMQLRDAFAPFARRNNCAILAPLFPQGIIDPNDQDNYKKLKYNDIRFDLVLLGMIDEVGRRWPKVETSKLLMQGFSGGGQFVHRFAYVHPGRLQAAVVGAPGSATVFDKQEDYPEGVKDIERVFGIVFDGDALRRVRTLFLVGELDTSVDHLRARRNLGSPCKDRRAILHDLQSSWSRSGIPAKLKLVPGIGHEGEGIYRLTEEYFASELARR